MNREQITRGLAVLALAALVPAAGWSFDGAGRRQGPPPEALTACEGKKAGDAAEFTNRRGDKVEGICREIDGRLVALPEKARSGRHLARLADKLDLTDEQQEKVATILSAERENVAPLLEKKRASRDQIRTAVHSGNGDEAALRALAAQEAAIEADLLVARAQDWQQINALLTPEQRQLASKLGPPGKEGGKRECRPRF